MSKFIAISKGVLSIIALIFIIIYMGVARTTTNIVNSINNLRMKLFYHVEISKHLKNLRDKKGYEFIWCPSCHKRAAIIAYKRDCIEIHSGRSHFTTDSLDNFRLTCPHCRKRVRRTGARVAA